MDMSEYYATLYKLVKEGCGWEAIQDLTKMMCQEWNESKTEARNLRWENNTIRKVAKSELTNKSKVDTIRDILREDGEDE